MKFHELSVNDKFRFNNQEYRKITEVRASCCRVKENCELLSNKQKAVLKPGDEVEKIN